MNGALALMAIFKVAVQAYSSRKVICVKIKHIKNIKLYEKETLDDGHADIGCGIMQK